MDYEKRVINSDPFPFTVGSVRLAYPGTLGGIRAEHNPRPEFTCIEWKERP